MRALTQAALYGGLALGLHLAGFAALAPTLGGMQASGAGGADRITLIPASPQLAAMVAEWTRPPVIAPETSAPVQHTPPLSAPPPPAPTAAPPVLPAAPSLAAPPAQPRPDRAMANPAPPKPVTRPKPAKPKPASARPAAKPRAAAPALRAKGAGGGARAGAGGKAQVSTPGGGGAAALTAAWGAEIAARIERRKRYPSGAAGATGKVGLALQVTATGALASARVTRGSGSAALDRAALDAVRRAAPFPRAPGGTGQGPFDFRLVMVFRR